jgi:hypothetical protein
LSIRKETSGTAAAEKIVDRVDPTREERPVVPRRTR